MVFLTNAWKTIWSMPVKAMSNLPKWPNDLLISSNAWLKEKEIPFVWSALKQWAINNRHELYRVITRFDRFSSHQRNGLTAILRCDHWRLDVFLGSTDTGNSAAFTHCFAHPSLPAAGHSGRHYLYLAKIKLSTACQRLVCVLSSWLIQRRHFQMQGIDHG